MEGTYIIYLVLLIPGLIIEIDSKSTPVIQTTKGPVQGEVLKTVVQSVEYSSFKGIPYAEAPLGYLRFKPPVPKKPWLDVLQTTVEGANCIQKDFVYHTTYTGSEDCLYLNVYTPKLEFKNTKMTDLLPVMVWIYGGSFKSGYGNSSLYGPDFIIEERVVLVTFNYRLGPLGFLNLNHKNATGNAALKDQNLVLRWVKDNIAKFGGNPDSVTIFGQSAGGVAVDFHGLSEMSKGLFHRSIAMSASPLCPWGFHTAEEAEKQAFVLGKKLGTTTISKETLLETLYKAPAIDIVKKSNDIGIGDPPFKPSIESTRVAKDQEKFMTECSYWKYISGNFNKVPYLTGFVAFETLLFAGSVESLLGTVNFATNIVKNFPKKSPISLPVTGKVTAMLANGTTGLSSTVARQLINETSDFLFVAGIDMKQKLIAAHSGRPVYYYRFSYDTYRSLHRLFYNINLNGTAHGDDFAYPFHMTLVDLPLEPNDPTYITRRRMTRMWTNFAKYSNPTPDGKKDKLLQGITWPEAGLTSRYLEFSNNLMTGQSPTSPSANAYRTASIAILPIQTGCVSNIIRKISNVNPFTFGSIRNTGKKVLKAATNIVPKFKG